MATNEELRRARLRRALVNNLILDFEANGTELVAKMRKDKPLDYLKLVNTILDEEDGDGAKLDATYNVIERRIVRPGDIDI